MTEVQVQHDEVSKMLAAQIESGIEQINEANVVLLADGTGTGDRDIDKLFKEEKVENKEAVAAWNKAEKARQTYRELLNKARNIYRTEELGEEEAPEIDKDAVQGVRDVVKSSLDLLVKYAKANGKNDLLKWAESIELPQVGRKGSSSVGSKKPRVYVSFDGNTYDSFGLAAKAWNESHEGASVTSGDLVQAWSDNNEADTFTFEGVGFKVAPKNTGKSE